jgi:RHS repeat-associated protein
MSYGDKVKAARLDFADAVSDLGEREYSSSLGRWVQQDPTGSDYIDGPDLYQFADSTPVAGTDPTGLRTIDDLGKSHHIPGTTPEELVPSFRDQLYATAKEWDDKDHYHLAARLLRHFLDNTGTTYVLNSDDIDVVRSDKIYQTLLFQELDGFSINVGPSTLQPVKGKFYHYWVPFMDGELAWAFGGADFIYEGKIIKDCEGRGYKYNLSMTIRDRYFFTGHSIFDDLFPDFYRAHYLEEHKGAAAFNDTGTWDESGHRTFS